ncbi:signal peptide peptidase SppA [Halalkalibacillus halophilus]|uniref:signal peptide peptidase SppA n=1 Tax=Halalkalibacillus halophilus TaxID=392827 RepID=UPI00041D5BCE|nr:signal peptide peptidase SppA [Halalkalibacillus halophilus]
MNKKRWIALGIAVGLFIVSLIAQFSTAVATTNWTQMFSDSDRSFSEETVEEGASLDGKIAVVHLNGVISSDDVGGVLNTGSYNHRVLLEMLEYAADDDEVEGVVVRVNTPGGGVVESEEIHDRILEIQEEAGKPVYVSMGNTAASGGYYVSAPAEKIYAHAATVTGSIGVIMESINVAELADNLGIEVNTIKSGEFKDIMSATGEMTEEDEAILQSMIDEMYDEFVSVIVNGRDMDENQVRELADGRVYTGTQAQENGLVDEVGDLNDVISAMKSDHDLDGAQVVEYEYELGFGSLFGGAAQKMFSREFQLSGLQDLVRDANAPRAMYLYTR